MHAIRQYEHGGPEVLLHQEIPDLVAGEGQVRMAVEACGVHYLDTVLRQGFTSAVHQPQRPMTPGREVSGQVDEIGPGVDPAWLGKRVVAHLGLASGGYAEQAVTAVANLHELPHAMAATAAVAAIGTGRTAVGILDLVPIGPDDIVLVTAAAGGLGVLLIQAARESGATVVALAGGADKLTIAREQGAHLAADYRTEGWDSEVRRELGGDVATIVFDAVGGAAGSAAYGCLPGGTRRPVRLVQRRPAGLRRSDQDRDDGARPADARTARRTAVAGDRGARARSRRVAGASRGLPVRPVRCERRPPGRWKHGRRTARSS
ncbi:alcohol dehydrogenase catalytic domain-containing protein [Aeromicrobium sp. UC242_57]|uniref:alcohol dehydrogenase catalytic domain-containing protein n=1 Tax=Aeromicrobium sp. UC242_57 TaxID=3374624 RepID=UPI00379101B3